MGPNGSGKSNIVDAVRWALGEQSMRDLRGQRTEDVIYAGPRRSLGAAEVSLTFEEESLGQPSWSTEKAQRSEVCLARRLYRSGESDYLVNRQKARLRDVVGTLRELGIDAGHHVIVNQGMADALLTATPLERRGLLEQAAGLSPYRDKREDARHKLTSIGQNIESAHMVLGELEPRCRLLRRQAKAVEERDEAIESLRVGLLDWYATKWRHVEETRRVLQADIEATAGERKLAADELERLESEAETALEVEREWHRRLEVVTAALHMSERERDAVKLDLDHLQLRVQIGQRAREQHHERVSQLQVPIEEAKHRKEAAEAALHQLRSSRIEQEMRQPHARSNISALQKELAERELQADQHRAAVDKAQEEQAKVYQAVLKVKGALSEQKHLLNLVDNRLAQSIDSLAEAARKVEQLDGDVRQAGESEKRALSDLESAEHAVATHRKRLDRLYVVISRTRLKETEKTAQLQSAEASLSRFQVEMSNSLIESLKVNPGWERAIASALGGWSKAGAGSTQYQLHNVNPTGFRDWRKSLESIVRPAGQWADIEVTAASDAASHSLMGTVLVDDEEHARKMWRRFARLPAFEIGSPPIQVVARSGQRWSSLGVKQYQEDNVSGKYLSARTRVVDLGRSAGHQQKRLQMLENARLDSEDAGQSLDEDLQSARGAVRTMQARLAEVTVAHERLMKFSDTLAAEQQSDTAKAGEIKTSIVRLSDEMGKLLASQDITQEQVERLRADAQAADLAVQEVKKKIALASEQVAKVRQEREAQVVREATHVEVMQLAQADTDRLSEELESHLREQHRLTHEIEILEAGIGEGCQRLTQLEAVITDQTQRLDQVRNQRPVVEQARALRDVRNRHLEVVGRHERLLAAWTQSEIERDTLRSEIWREVEIEPARLPFDIDQSPTDEELRRLRHKAVQYSDADESVVAEYEELTQRQGYLRQHLEDLNAAQNNLTEIMQVADSEMHARFKTAFEEVSEEFGRVFQIMLQGGSARLEQIDQDGAIEIRAQLPGRRAISSHAFSGGERALVASSLLFGVLRIKPAPFCILDEVDAPLDESNVDRYLTVLRELSQKTQMIVVTHNRASMAAADALYGLTMDDQGVSNLLSLRLDAYDAVG